MVGSLSQDVEDAWSNLLSDALRTMPDRMLARLISCRVLGRRVEEAILQYLVEQARRKGITSMVGRYIPSAKNGLVRDHFSRLGPADEQSPEFSGQRRGNARIPIRYM